MSGLVRASRDERWNTRGHQVAAEAVLEVEPFAVGAELVTRAHLAVGTNHELNVSLQVLDRTGHPRCYLQGAEHARAMPRARRAILASLAADDEVRTILRAALGIDVAEALADLADR